MRNIEVSLETSINKIHCGYSNRISDSSTQDSHSGNHDRPKKALIKLPKTPQSVSIIKFKEWNLFTSIFNTLINGNPDLFENEKIFYFRRVLIGESKIIETSHDNYTSFLKP